MNGQRISECLLHQSAENFLRTISMVFILYGHKSHDLSELMNAAKKHTTEIFKAFPRDTAEKKRLFDLLQRACIELRYNPDFEIGKADIDASCPKSSSSAIWSKGSAANGSPTIMQDTMNNTHPIQPDERHFVEGIKQLVEDARMKSELRR